MTGITHNSISPENSFLIGQTMEDIRKKLGISKYTIAKISIFNQIDEQNDFRTEISVSARTHQKERSRLFG